MVELIKLLLKGLLFIVLSPFYAIYYVGMLVYALILHIVNDVKAILMYFAGKSINEDDKETKLLKDYQQQLLDANNPLKQLHKEGE